MAALVRARTRDQFGNELGDFTEDTRPTADQVSNLIAQEAAIVLVRTGDPTTLECPTVDNVRTAMSTVIAKRVAAIVEASYRPDEVADGRTVADFYQGQMAEDLKAVTEAAAECRLYDPADPSSGEPGSGMSPSWYFEPGQRLGQW